MNTTTRNLTSNSRRTGRLARRLAAASVVAGTLFGVAAGPASAGPGLGGNVATIKQTGLQRGGTYAGLQWTANVPSTVVEISTNAPQQVNGTWKFAMSPTAATVQKENGAFQYDALGLKPSTKYHVILTALASGNVGANQAVGEFTTKIRTLVLASFDSIHVIDDGDSGTKGAGDLWWHFDTSFSSWSSGWHRSATSGSTFAVDFNGVGPIVAGGCCVTGSSVTVTLQAVEDDVYGPHDSRAAGFGEYSGAPETWSTHCSEGAFAQAEVQLPSYVWESQPRSFEATTGTSGRTPIQFTVSGTVQAIYE